MPLLSLLLALPAHADTDGAVSTVSAITTLTASSSSYVYWHTVIVIGGVTFYSGGRACNGIPELSDGDLLTLDTALHEGMAVNPWYQTSGSFLCLTSFRIYR